MTETKRKIKLRLYGGFDLFKGKGIVIESNGDVWRYEGKNYVLAISAKDVEKYVNFFANAISSGLVYFTEEEIVDNLVRVARNRRVNSEKI
jgi:hypothetical protein